VTASLLSFGHPVLLLGLLLVPLAAYGWLRLERRRAESARAWSNPALLPNMLPADPGRRRYLPPALFLLALALFLVGFARPQATRTVPKEGATVVLALDVSGSMDAKDVRPTRLLAADAAIADFVKHLPSKYRAALVTFSNRPTVKVPPTYAHQLVTSALPTKAEPEATAIGDAVSTAALVAAKAVGTSKPGTSRPPAAVILLSDGLQNFGKLSPLAAAAQARKLGVPVYGVSIGTPDGVVNQKIGSYTKTTHVPVAAGDLRAIAQATDARFYQAASPGELSQVYRDLGSRLAHERTKREITVWTTAGAIVLVVAGAVLSSLWFRRAV
jgi:Ca-activated chloride channel family protein